MQKIVLFLFALVCILGLTACSEDGLVDMAASVEEGKFTIHWEGRTYQPFCVVSKTDCGRQLGYLNGDKNDRVSEYKGQKPEKWLVSWMPMDGGAILYKEAGVMEIPPGLEQEYF